MTHNYYITSMVNSLFHKTKLNFSLITDIHKQDEVHQDSKFDFQWHDSQGTEYEMSL